MEVFVKPFAVFIVIASLLFGAAIASADSPQEAQAFFESIKDKDLIIDDVSRLTPEEMRDMIQITHDFCRYGKALRLQKYRDLVDLGLAKSAALSQDEWDARYYEINFGIDFTTEIINGYVQVHAASLVPGLSFIELDLLDNMTVDSVKMNGTALGFTHSGDLINITLDGTYDSSDAFSVYVYYQGHPTEGGFQAFAFGTHGSGIPVATTLSEPYFARSWWPCKDYPDDKADSVDIIITHPDDFVCASNGLVESIVDNGDGTKTTHWKHRYPITTYLVCIGVTNYAEFQDWYYMQSGDSMPVDFYVYPEYLSQATTSYPVTVDMVDTLSGIFGEYPFVNEKYGMLHFDWGGAMEHQTNTSMNSSAYYESIIVHELGHQWWGDMITCENWHEIWMNEGFASYVEALWFETTQGTAYYHEYMNNMAYYNGGTIYCQDTTSVWSIFSSRVYDKGAWVLHMLRHWVGDSVFFDILQTYYDDPRYKWKTITTNQFRDLCIEVSGDTRLNQFFQDWIYGEYYPEYRFSYVYDEYQPGDYVIYLHLRQAQTTSPQVFDMPIDLKFFDGVQYHDAQVYNDQRDQDYIIFMDNLAGDPYVMRLDDDDWILKSSTLEGYGFNAIYDPLDTAHQYYSYSDSVIVKGGTPPYNYYRVAGPLPAGIILNQFNGKITGTPTDTGNFQFKVRIEDSGYPTKVDSVILDLYVQESPILVGDANFDGTVNVSDAVYVINYVFVQGPAPKPVLASGDANCDTLVNVSDAVWIINYVFTGGPAPGDC
jgi:aminopeptidase N